MAKRLVKPAGRIGLYPVPLAVITAANGRGESNAMTVAWIGIVCSEPPMISVSIRPSRHTFPMVAEGGEFVANLPDESVLPATDFCGWASGKDLDKFAEMGLTRLPATKVAAPLIAEFPVNLECVVKHSLHLGTHDVFISEVVAIHADEAILNEKGVVDYSRTRPVVFLEPEYWSLKEKVGSYGFTAKERKAAKE